MRKAILLVVFSVLTPGLLLFSLIFLLLITYQTKDNLYYANERELNAFSYAALPMDTHMFSDAIVGEEGRVEIVRQFLMKYNSPLEPYADVVVKTADKYGIDFRLIPAIAMQESNVCKKIPAGSHNCWGFGIYGGKVTMFENYAEAIETVTKTLATKYKQRGLVTPEEIMSMYTPSSNGSWAKGVRHFMKQLQ